MATDTWTLTIGFENDSGTSRGCLDVHDLKAKMNAKKIIAMEDNWRMRGHSLWFALATGPYGEVVNFKK